MKNYQLIKKEQLHYLKASNHHPSDTYFHFSFADYYDPANINFGKLRVINDDFIKANSGFSTHPHKDMEIFSYILDGELTHKDSTGNTEKLLRGYVQAISAGTGVYHSEINEGNEQCRLLQIWVYPNEKNLPVSYTINKVNPEERENKLLQIISSTSKPEDAKLNINQDFAAYVSELNDKDTEINFTVGEDRQIYLYSFEGSIMINSEIILEEMDSLKLWEKTDLSIKLNSEKAHFIILEMEKSL